MAIFIPLWYHQSMTNANPTPNVFVQRRSYGPIRRAVYGSLLPLTRGVHIDRAAPEADILHVGGIASTAQTAIPAMATTTTHPNMKTLRLAGT
jgi:hypothetical protein